MTETNNILFKVRDYSVKYLEAVDGPELQKLFERDPDYFLLTCGLPPGPSEAQSTYIGLPEEKEYQDKLLMGVFKTDGELCGVLDVIRDHPEAGVWTIGLIFLDPQLRGKHLGDDVYRAFEQWATASGARLLRLGVVEQNRQAYHFWEQMGFQVVERQSPVQTGARESTIVVMVKRVI